MIPSKELSGDSALVRLVMSQFGSTRLSINSFLILNKPFKKLLNKEVTGQIRLVKIDPEWDNFFMNLVSR